MKRHDFGFTFVEIIIAIGLAALIMPALSRALSFSIRVASQGENFTKANALAVEGMESIFYIKASNDPNWAWTNASPVQGVYQPTKSGSVWVLNTPVGTPLAGPEKFTRTIQVDPVDRDINNNIVDSGVQDQKTRKVTVYVTWPEAVGVQTASMSAYVTAH